MKHETLLMVSTAAAAMLMHNEVVMAEPGQDTPCRVRNVLFVLVDDLGWKDTGCYGSTFYKTPNIDRFAESAVRFTEAYSANPLCCPTRSSILTGCYPVRTGFTSANGHIPGDLKHEEATRAAPDQRAAGPSSINHLPLEYFTLGKAMKAVGYQTGYFGKWHMGYAPYIPENHGFGTVVGGRAHSGPPGTNPARAFFPPWDCDTLPDNPPADLHIDDYITDKAVEFIAANKHKPFYIHFNFYNVHAPFQCKPELVEKWKKQVDLCNPQHSPTMAAMIEMVDVNFGRLLAALKKNGLEENTIVIFTSDNGGNMYDVVDGTTPTCNLPLRSGKGNNYEGGVRVPLLVRCPGLTGPGVVSDAIVSSVDHYPAILEMTGQALRPQDHQDGISYVPALKGLAFDRGPTICDFTHFVPATMNIPNSTVRDGDWKLYRFWFDGPGQTHRYQLYNLKEDIGETRNLAAAHPEQLQAMIAMLDGYYERTGALKPNRNEAYNGRTVGVWTAQTNGTTFARDNTLVLRADEPQFGISTRVTPSIVDGAILEFEARAETASSVTVQWTSGAQPKFGAPQGAIFSLSKDWKNVRTGMSFNGRIDQIRFVLGEVGQTTEIRNVRLFTPQGTLMTAYEFY